MTIMVGPSTPEEDSNTSTLLIPFNRYIHRPETGADTVIAQLPDGLASPLPETPGASPMVAMLLMKVSAEEAGRMGLGLRMAAWWITRDPDVVKERGLVHDCDECREAVDRAVAAMEAEPGVVLAVGHLSWCEP